MIKRLLVLIALLCVMGTMFWLNVNPMYTLPVTLLGLSIVISPLAVLSFAVFALFMTLVISIGFHMC
jgi:hypothetical protein